MTQNNEDELEQYISRYQTPAPSPPVLRRLFTDEDGDTPAPRYEGVWFHPQNGELLLTNSQSKKMNLIPPNEKEFDSVSEFAVVPSARRQVKMKLFVKYISVYGLVAVVSWISYAYMATWRGQTCGVDFNSASSFLNSLLVANSLWCGVYSVHIENFLRTASNFLLSVLGFLLMSFIAYVLQVDKVKKFLKFFF